eukprot:16264-Heterococcus_DN1.PRE.2
MHNDNHDEHTDDETQYGVGDDAVSDELQPLEHDNLHELELAEHLDESDSIASSFDTVDANGQSVHSLEDGDTEVQTVEVGDVPEKHALQEVAVGSSAAAAAADAGTADSSTTAIAAGARAGSATDDDSAPTSL